MSGFETAYTIYVKDRLKAIETELKTLKEQFEIDNIRKVFHDIVVELSNYCRNDCKSQDCSECKIGKVINIVESKLSDIDKIRSLELQFLKLFSKYADVILSEIESDLESIDLDS